MFITTKAEFIWDGEKYVETYTEGYEYEGEIALLDLEDDLSSSSGGTGGTGGTGGYGGPSLYDLTNKDIASIMKDMGFDPEDIEKYAGYIPEFDPWKAEYAEEEKGIGMARIGIEEKELGPDQLYV